MESRFYLRQFWQQFWKFGLRLGCLSFLTGNVVGMIQKPAFASSSVFPFSLSPSHPAKIISIPLTLAQAAEFELEDFEFWSEQCLLLSQETDYAKTQETCEKAISLRPRDRNLELWFARSYALFQLGQYVEAMGSFDQVLKYAPRDSISIAYQCASLFQLSRPEDAVDTCEEALQIDGNWGTDSPAIAWYYRGLALQSMGRLETALVSYERALINTPDDLIIQAGRCAIAAELGQFDRCSLAAAVIAYEQALAVNPDDATLWFQQGLALEQLGRFEQALTSYESAIAIKANYSLALAHQCAVLNELETYEAALAACDAAMQGDGNWDALGSVYGWSQRSAAQIGIGEYEAALASADRAVAINPDYSGGWNNRAVSLWHLGEPWKAERAIAIAYETEQVTEALFSENFDRTYPESPMLFRRRQVITAFNEGVIVSDLQAYQQAVSAYQRSLDTYQTWQLKLQDGQLVDDHFLATLWTNFAVAQLYAGYPSSAFTAAQRAPLYNQDSFDAWYNLGLIALSAGQYNRAWTAYEQAAILNPEQIEVVIGQGLTLVRAQCPQEAIQVFEQILNLDPSNSIAQQQYAQLVAAREQQLINAATSGSSASSNAGNNPAATEMLEINMTDVPASSCLIALQ